MHVVDVDEGLATAYILLFKLEVMIGKRETVERQGTKDALASPTTLDLPLRVLTNKIEDAVWTEELDVSCQMTHRRLEGQLWNSLARRRRLLLASFSRL
jgi:hypothetical protein